MLIVTGLLRKCVVADNCALIANAAFEGRLGDPGLGSSLIGIYAFAWQIYGDFSGYSDIARGSAQLLGFHFMVNFRQPYLATSLQDFWRRWHISLSTWLRDYLYIPLGGNRHGEFQTYRNLLLTMLIGGFWHGANWTFVIWGAIHGGGLALERLLFGGGESSASPFKYKDWLKRIWIFHLVCLAWVFFRAQSVGAALQYLSNFGKWNWRPEHQTAALLVGAYALVLFLMDLLNEQREEEYLLERASPRLRIAVAWGLICIIFFFTGNQSNAFIYFQF